MSTTNANTRAGTCRGGLGEGRRCLPCELRREPRRGRRGVLRLRRTAAPSSTCGAASPIARRTGRGTRTPSSPSHPRPKALPRSARICWCSAASSIWTPRWSSTGRSSALPARSRSRCAGCFHTRPACRVIDGPLTFEEACAWDPVIRALEAQKPEWEPGTEHVYHSMTFGFLVGEIVRRITGKSLGTFFAEEVAAPLGLSAWIGLPEEQEGRVAAGRVRRSVHDGGDDRRDDRDHRPR